MMSDADATRNGNPPYDNAVQEIEHRVWLVQNEMPETSIITVPDYAPIVKHLEGLDASLRDLINVRVGRPLEPLGDRDYLDWLREAYTIGFGPDIKATR